MNIEGDEIMVNISGLVQSPPTDLPFPTTNQQVQKEMQRQMQTQMQRQIQRQKTTPVPRTNQTTSDKQGMGVLCNLVIVAFICLLCAMCDIH